MIERRPKPSSVGGWVLYDVANTVFWTGVVGLTFPLWLTKDLNGDDATLGYTLSATMAAVIVLAPIVGAISDQAGRRVPFLMVTTFVCIVATLLLGEGSLLVSLALFAVALCSMEQGVVLYNSLLSEVSTPENRGRIAGLGIGIGYIGAFIAVGVALLFTDPKGYVFVFRVVAILFLVFSLPIFFLLRERPRPSSRSSAIAKVRQAFQQLNYDLRNLDRFPGLRTYLLVRFFWSIGVSTVTVFAVVYASQTIGLSDREIELILLAGISVSIPSAILWGRLVDRVGPQRVMSATLLVWIGLLLFAAGIPWLSWTSHLWWLVGCITGIAMAGVFTADRPFMLSFTPRQYLGEFFGLHSTVSKSGRVLGPFMWGFISSTLDLGQPAAILSLTGCLMISYGLLNGLKIPIKAPSADLAD